MPVHSSPSTCTDAIPSGDVGEADLTATAIVARVNEANTLMAEAIESIQARLAADPVGGRRLLGLETAVCWVADTPDQRDGDQGVTLARELRAELRQLVEAAR